MSTTPHSDSLPPRALDDVDNLFKFFLRDLVGCVTAMAAECGDISHVVVGKQTFVLVNHPDLVRDVLVTNYKQFEKAIRVTPVRRILGDGLLTAEGETHVRSRRLSQPAFHRDRIASYAETMVEYAVREQAWWTDGETRDMTAEMTRLTLAIVAKTLFGADVEAEEARDVGEAMAELSGLSNLSTIPFFDQIDKLSSIGSERFEAALETLDRALYRIIAERRRDTNDRGDLLSMLLSATDDDGGGMSDKQLRDESMTLFLAGHETTATALTWTWYLLAQHPDVEARVHAEIDTVLGGRVPTIDDVRALPYTERVITESMRLYSPVWIMARRVLEDYHAGGYVVPAGGYVLMSQHLLHRDPRFYTDVDTFDPDRWTPEMKAALPKFAYFPFGGGPRVCIGEGFAWTEAILLVATIASRWRMRTVDGFVPELQPGIVLRPKHGVPMIFEKRVHRSAQINTDESV